MKLLRRAEWLQLSVVLLDGVSVSRRLALVPSRVISNKLSGPVL